MPNSRNDQARLEPREMLATWANDHDEWLRRLVQLVLKSSSRMSIADCGSVYSLFLEEKGLNERRSPSEPKLAVSASAPEQDTAIALTSISEVRGVNALVADSRIDFSPGLTLLFGENGTGKTGYARILKCLADSRSAEDILPNMDRPQISPGPSAKIAYRVGDTKLELDWQGERRLEPFTRMSVFDTPALYLHVDENLGYLYTPTALALFTHITQGIRDIQQAIEQDIRAINATDVDLSSRFSRRSSIYPLIEGLSATTDLEELRKHSVIRSDVADRLDELNRTIATLRADISGPLMALERRVSTVLRDCAKYAEAIGQFSTTIHNRNVARLLALRDDYAAVRRVLFAAADLPAPPDSTWESFIRAGQTYRTHLDDLGLHDQERCLYCRQPLTDEAARLILKYGSYIDDRIAGEIQALEAATASLSQPVLDASLSLVRALSDEMRPDDERSFEDKESVTQILRTILDCDAQLREQMKATQPVDQDLVAKVEQQVSPIAEAVSKVSGRIKRLREQSTTRDEILQTEHQELIELEDRIQLAKSWPEIKQRISKLQRFVKLSRLKSENSTVLREITNLSKRATEQMTNENFLQLFKEECSELRAPMVTLEFVGRRGEAQRRRVLSKVHRPSEILSEGEQKSLALADFIAEARLTGSTAPIIFDDPICSLDHRRAKEVANRIAWLSVSHQVIVFTHDILFTAGLLQQVKGSDRFRFYQVSGDDGIGKVQPSTALRLDTISDLRTKIRKTIEEALSKQGDARAELVRTGYGHLRSWCEVFVEREMLAEVTQRYQPYVRMTALRRIKPSALALARETVLGIFEDASRYIDSHSQPIATLGIAPTLKQLEQDWETLQECRKQYQDAPSQ